MGEVDCVFFAVSGRRAGLARDLGGRLSGPTLGSVLGCSLSVCAADDAHGMQQTRTATGKGNPTV